MGFVSPRDCHAFGSQKPLSVIARSDSDEAILGQAAQSRPAEIATPTSWARNDGREGLAMTIRRRLAMTLLPAQVFHLSHISKPSGD